MAGRRQKASLVVSASPWLGKYRVLKSPKNTTYPPASVYRTTYVYMCECVSLCLSMSV